MHCFLGTLANKVFASPLHLPNLKKRLRNSVYVYAQQPPGNLRQKTYKTDSRIKEGHFQYLKALEVEERLYDYGFHCDKLTSCKKSCYLGIHILMYQLLSENSERILVSWNIYRCASRESGNQDYYFASSTTMRSRKRKSIVLLMSNIA